MKNLVLVLPETPSDMLKKMIEATIGKRNITIVKDEIDLPDLSNCKIVFAVELNKIGFSNNLANIFEKLYNKGSNSLKESDGILLIHSEDELLTKSASQSIIFHANRLGCRFIGRPLVEATGNLNNFYPMLKVYEKPLEDICLNSCEELGMRFLNDQIENISHPKILILHSSNRKTSNSLTLWDIVKKNLINCDIKEVHIENGTITDCKGCPYKTCKHYGKQTSCFYGGFVVEEIYPAILETDSILFICPNYNDSISANMMAVINRMTALFRKTKFYDKTLFSIIVSGYSGSDILAKQLISSLNINKTFRLPPYFSLMATANDRGTIKNVPHIKEKAKKFAENIIYETKK